MVPDVIKAVDILGLRDLPVGTKTVRLVKFDEPASASNRFWKACDDLLDTLALLVPLVGP